MRIQRWGVVALMLLASAASATPPETAPQRVELDVDGALTINARGDVEKYEVTSVLPADIKRVVTSAVDQWRFEPVVRDGKPVQAKVQMFLFLTGVPEQGGYRLRVERVQFGFARRLVKAPGVVDAYPRSALRSGVGAEILVAVRIDADGNVLDSALLRSRLVPAKRDERLNLQWRTEFEQGVAKALRNAKFDPADPARGDAPVVSMVFPLQFRPQSGRRHALLWTQADAAVTGTGAPAWLGGELKEDALDRLQEGQNFAVDGAPKLATQVVGTTL
jgi:hypothetical protein